MAEKDQEQKSDTNISSVFLGMLMGGMAGAITMLLLAPQAGKKTRSEIQEKGIDLYDRATFTMKDAMEQLRLDGVKITNDGREKSKELLHQSQMLVVEQLERVSEVAKTWEKAIQNSKSFIDNDQGFVEEVQM